MLTKLMKCVFLLLLHSGNVFSQSGQQCQFLVDSIYDSVAKNQIHSTSDTIDKIPTKSLFISNDSNEEIRSILTWAKDETKQLTILTIGNIDLDVCTTI